MQSLNQQGKKTFQFNSSNSPIIFFQQNINQCFPVAQLTPQRAPMLQTNFMNLKSQSPYPGVSPYLINQ